VTHATFLLHPGTNDDMTYGNVVERNEYRAEFPVLLSALAISIARRRIPRAPRRRAARHVRVRGLGPFTIDVLAAHLARSGSAVTLEPQATAQSGAPGAVLRRSKIAARVN